MIIWGEGVWIWACRVDGPQWQPGTDSETVAAVIRIDGRDRGSRKCFGGIEEMYHEAKALFATNKGVIAPARSSSATCELTVCQR